ncbi:MAG: nucleotidyltransferase family protein [Mariprofundus sp.]|nr:nucleotidyltransferase family protein [Mariprofundus sp.]
MKKIERAVILAAGLGTRLRWLTHGRPKALMQVGGVPVIGHVIRALVAQGVRDIAVNLHHHAELLSAYLGDGSRFACHLSLSYEPVLLDSGGGVKKALQLLAGDDPFAVWNADVLANVNVQRLATHLPAHGAAISLVTNPSHHPNGDFGLEHGSVIADSHEAFTFAGVSVWHAEAFAAYQSGAVFPLTAPMRQLIEKQSCAGVFHHGEWFDIGRPRDLLRANQVFSGASL